MITSSSCVNKVFLVGNIETLPILEKGINGRPRACFNLLTREVLRKGGQKSEHIEMHQLFLEENHEDFRTEVPKGTLVHITGRIQTRPIIGDDGVKRYKTEIAVLQLEVLS